MKVLVTGGSGFIGRHVVRELLSRGHVVRVLARSTSKQPVRLDSGGTAEHIRQDLRDPAGLREAVEGVDTVVHCAAAMSGDLQTQLANTVEGTKNLLAAMEKAGVAHIVNLSSFAVYDYLRLRKGSLVDEMSPLEDPSKAHGPYIEAKLRQEFLIQEYCDKRDWNWTTLRPGIVFGTDRTWFYHLGIQAGLRRWICFSGDALLPSTYVENCAAAIVAAIDRKAARRQVLNIVDDDLPTRLHYLQALSQYFLPRPSIHNVPWPLLDALSATATFVHKRLPGMNAPLPDLLRQASLHARCKPLRYSNAKAKDVLGWAPQWNLQQALRRTHAQVA